MCLALIAAQVNTFYIFSTLYYGYKRYTAPKRYSLNLCYLLFSIINFKKKSISKKVETFLNALFAWQLYIWILISMSIKWELQVWPKKELDWWKHPVTISIIANVFNNGWTLKSSVPNVEKLYLLMNETNYCYSLFFPSMIAVIFQFFYFLF